MKNPDAIFKSFPVSARGNRAYRLYLQAPVSRLRADRAVVDFIDKVREQEWLATATREEISHHNYLLAMRAALRANDPLRPTPTRVRPI